MRPQPVLLVLAMALVVGAASVGAGERWLLMIPPVLNGKVDSTAPVSEWLQVRAADSATECEQLKDGVNASFDKQPLPTTKPGSPEHQRLQDVQAARVYMRCVPALP